MDRNRHCRCKPCGIHQEMDIPPLLIRRFFGIPVSITMYGFDVLILLLQASFSDRTQILYGILLVLIYTMVLEKVLIMGEAKTQVKIVSAKYEAINDMIIRDLDRGSTLLHGETGFMREERPVLLTVISNRELAKLNRAVQEIDPEAFLVMAGKRSKRQRFFQPENLGQAGKAPAGGLTYCFGSQNTTMSSGTVRAGMLW